MKKGFFLIFLFFIIQTVTAQKIWSVGDRVWANWSGDRYWYTGTIIEAKDNLFHIQFDDCDREWLPAPALREEEIKSGMIVYGNWLLKGAYYKGRIAAVKGMAVWIHYDDGDKEWTTVMAVRVIF